MTARSSKPTVLVVEDEASITEALQYQLTREGFEVRSAAGGATGLRRFEEGDIDFVVLDLMLPEMSGEDVCRAIRRVSDVPILMLTAKDGELDKVIGLEIGADDYVTKPFSGRELVARIRALLRRTHRAEGSTRVLSGGGIVLDPDGVEVSVRGEPVALARREFELLEYMMARPNKVVRREVLLEDLWGFEYGSETRTLDVHVKRLRAKVEKEPAHPVHLVTVRGVGYRFNP